MLNKYTITLIRNYHKYLITFLYETIKTKFTEEMDLASRKVLEHEKIRIAKEHQNYEFSNLIEELDRHNLESVVQNRNLEEKYGDLKNDYDYLKESYDELIKENEILKTDNFHKDEKIESLQHELADVKNVIGKLTEVRVILNKYFSSYFENFR